MYMSSFVKNLRQIKSFFLNSIFLLVKFSLKKYKAIGFAVFTFFVISLASPQKCFSSISKKPALPKTHVRSSLKVKLIGEIIGYSYIKMSLESSNNAKRYKNLSIPVKGSYYEAINSKTFRVVGSFNTQTLVWKLDCFDNNTHCSVFIGKENADGLISGHWTSKKTIRRFYLTKTED